MLESLFITAKQDKKYAMFNGSNYCFAKTINFRNKIYNVCVPYLQSANLGTYRNITFNQSFKVKSKMLSKAHPNNAKILSFITFEPHHEKTCFCHMQTYPYPHSLISTFVIHCLDCIICVLFICKISSL